MSEWDNVSDLFKVIMFEVKPEHIKLLRRTYIGWNDCEFGAPEIDPKRPYGNSSVYCDIAEILGIEPELGECGDKGFSEEQEEYMLILHRGLQKVLQIAVLNADFKPGIYESKEYHTHLWRFQGSTPSAKVSENEI